MAKIRVLVADDHAMVRQGLKVFMEIYDDLEVVGEASNGAEAVSLADRLKPDVVLMDLLMPEVDGIEATRRLKEQDEAVKVIVLTSFVEDKRAVEAIRAGAIGFQMKDIRPADLVETIRGAYRGEPQLHPRVSQLVLKELTARASDPKPVEELTPREMEVLRMVAKGMNNREIADALFLSEKTVKTHVSNILHKLDLADRTQAAVYAIREKLVEVE